jgi:hypothetical protein
MTGAVLASLVVGVLWAGAIGAMAAAAGPAWHCLHCGERFYTEGDLLAHEASVTAARERHPAYLPEETAS